MDESECQTRDSSHELANRPFLGGGYFEGVFTGLLQLVSKQWKKEQASRCCTADVCLCQSLNQPCNNNKMAKHVCFSTACL